VLDLRHQDECQQRIPKTEHEHCTRHRPESQPWVLRLLIRGYPARLLGVVLKHPTVFHDERHISKHLDVT
jgi:hypothetical protein